MRRSHHALKPVNVVIDQESGEYRLPHQMCNVDKTYRGRKIEEELEDQEDSE